MYDEFITEINDFLESEKIMKKVKLLQPPDSNLGDFCIVLNQYSKNDDLSSLKIMEEMDISISTHFWILQTKPHLL